MDGLFIDEENSGEVSFTVRENTCRFFFLSKTKSMTVKLQAYTDKPQGYIGDHFLFAVIDGEEFRIPFNSKPFSFVCGGKKYNLKKGADAWRACGFSTFDDVLNGMLGACGY